MRRFVLKFIGIATALTYGAIADAQTRDPGAFKPASTISPEWQRFWPMVVQGKPQEPPLDPADKPAWERAADAFEKRMAPLVSGLMNSPRFAIKSVTIGGVSVLDISPAKLIHPEQRLIYVHGGGFTSLSARSSLFQATAMAASTGRRVLSIDYTLAPKAKWRQITDQVILVYNAIVGQGIEPTKIGMWGDSAGGAIVAGSILKLRDQGRPLPGGVVLWSPWADISGAGDTYQTLAAFDPILSNAELSASALAYADAADHRKSYVSPIYGDYRKGFPATLIQGGTRDMFLSNMVRQYQALLKADVPVTLDLYEGMVHVFQPMAPRSPEGIAALEQNNRFWDRVLK